MQNMDPKIRMQNEYKITSVANARRKSGLVLIVKLPFVLLERKKSVWAMTDGM